VYADHIASLFVPGRRVRLHDVVPDELAEVGTLEGWTDNDVELLIGECRIALATQDSRFDRMRTTAQVLLPLAIAMLVIFGTALPKVGQAAGSQSARIILITLWIVGTFLVVLSALGAAATLSVRSDFGSVFAPLVSRLESPVAPKLAKEYAGQVAIGEKTLGTRITVIRDAVTLLILGGVLHLVLWFIRTV
jgi:hypothetical protein